jgi:hypothetical protein
MVLGHIAVCVYVLRAGDGLDLRFRTVDFGFRKEDCGFRKEVFNRNLPSEIHNPQSEIPIKRLT